MTTTGPVVVNTDHAWIQVDDVIVAPRVRRDAVALAVGVGLSEAVCADIAIVATELATNLGRHARNGRVLIRVCRSHDRAGIGLVAIDDGPGITDVEASIRDGHSTRGTLGIGLGAIRRLAGQFDIYSQPGHGTVIAATIWGRAVGGNEWVDGISRPISGDTECGDGYAAREIDGRRQVMLCDGLGHGPLASIAARALEHAFQQAPPIGPKALLDHLHATVRHTRGAVMGIAELVTGSSSLRYAGIGNVAA
ncbi:MAG TPA: ATP-binding SpoIIE family protein phosphatase, partial [Micromonosporaceae bacterium]